VVEVTLAKAHHKLSGGIEFVDRIECGVGAGLLNRSARTPRRYCRWDRYRGRHLPDLAALGDRQPVGVEAVWTGGGIRVGGHHTTIPLPGNFAPGCAQAFKSAPRITTAFNARQGSIVGGPRVL